MTAALALGYQPVGDYATTVGEEINWLVESASYRDGGYVLLGSDDGFFSSMFDYEAEDRYLVGRSVAE